MLVQQALKHVPPPAYLSVYNKIAFASWTECYGSCNPYLTLAENISERTQAQMRTKWHPLNSALYSWYKTNLPNLLLTSIGDRTEMSHSIEGRTPFLDHNLVEYVNGIPPSLKIKYIADKDKLTEKWILREASKPFVTPELYERKKHVSLLASWTYWNNGRDIETNLNPAVLGTNHTPSRGTSPHPDVSSHHQRQH